MKFNVVIEYDGEHKQHNRILDHKHPHATQQTIKAITSVLYIEQCLRMCATCSDVVW